MKFLQLIKKGETAPSELENGVVYYDENTDKVTLKQDPYNGHKYVDLGLPSGLKWASCNVGATSETEYGKYFMWGDVEGEYVEGTTTTRNYSFGNAPYYSGSSKNDYRTDAYPPATTLDLKDDAAHVHMGGNWRMPTTADTVELKANTTSVWTSKTTSDGTTVYGREFTSNTNGNKLFIPASGYCSGTSLYRKATDGYYWSTPLNSRNPYFAYNLLFYSNGVEPQNYTERFNGFSVRGVSE